MFITKEQAETITGYDVDTPLLMRAQSIIEAYVGRIESEIDDAGDLALLGKATAYQAAYMQDDRSRVFEQMAVNQVGQFGQIMSFRYDDYESPFIAPLARISCRHLSWRRSRSITTGSIFGYPPVSKGWEYE